MPPQTTTRTRRHSRAERAEARTGVMFLVPFLALFCLVFVAPIVVSLRASFLQLKSTGGDLFGGGEQVQTFVGLENYRVAATTPAFWQGLGRVFAFGAFQIPFMILAALALALLLDSALVRRPQPWRLLYFLPFAVPGVVAAITWTYLYVPALSPFAGALPDRGGQPFLLSPGVVLASMANMTTWTYTGYNMLIFLAALQAVPRDLYEAARIDGANGWKIATLIKIPLVRGAALLAVLLSIIGTVQLFNEPTVLRTVATWIPNDYTPMMMAYNTATNQINPGGAGPASAISILMALISGGLAAIYAAVQLKVTRP